MELFDCYCCYGEMRLQPPSYSKKARELLTVMDGCGIRNALVFHSTMKYGSPVFGNKLVIEESRGGICVQPDDVEEILRELRPLLDSENLRIEMGANGRRAVERLYSWEVEEEKLLAFYSSL